MAVVKSTGKQLGPVQARKLTDCIKGTVEMVWELIAKAYSERAWAALGYDSWDDYCETEFSGTRLRMPREERAEVVSSLRESGLSLRAIEAATGVSRPTIIKDLADAQVVKFLPPEPPGGVTASTPGRTDRVAAALASAQAKQDVAPVEPIKMPEKITGTDGKTYTAQQPRQQRRRPITDAFNQSARDLTRVVERIERLAADDRFKGNIESLSRHRYGMTRARDALDAVISELPDRIFGGDR